jgi:hypothetical protein
MDNVQNCDSYINIPSSQTYRSDLRSVPSLSFPLLWERHPFTSQHSSHFLYPEKCFTSRQEQSQTCTESWVSLHDNFPHPFLPPLMIFCISCDTYSRNWPVNDVRTIQVMGSRDERNVHLSSVFVYRVFIFKYNQYIMSKVLVHSLCFTGELYTSLLTSSTLMLG